jgi:hypothetical protein
MQTGVTVFANTGDGAGCKSAAVNGMHMTGLMGSLFLKVPIVFLLFCCDSYLVEHEEALLAGDRLALTELLQLLQQAWVDQNTQGI